MRTTVCTAVLAAGVVAAMTLGSADAFAVGDATAELAQGGTVKGDISTQAEETDRIGFDLIAGEPYDLRFAAGFSATLVLTDPDGGTVTLPFTSGGRKLKAKGLIAAKTGRHEFRIGSADGSQGTYKLQAKAAWQKTLKVGPITTQTMLDIPMPGDSAISALFKGPTVTVNQVVAPDDAVIAAGVTGTSKLVKLPPTTCDLPGVYHIDVSVPVGTFSGVVTRVLPKVRQTNVSIANGLDRISFADSGLGQYFKARCANCHFWAAGYGGVRAYAKDSLGRMRSGNMPEGGPRAPNETNALLEQWIKTGYGR